MARRDAAGVNGSNRIRSHGAPRLRMTPNGCLGSPVLILLFDLDRGPLMDVGPLRARHFGLGAQVDWRVGFVISIRETSAACGPIDPAWSAFPIELGSIP
jgi:hypothetical protein